MVTTATEGETDEIDVDESKRVLDNIEKDENGKSRKHNGDHQIYSTLQILSM